MNSKRVLQRVALAALPAILAVAACSDTDDDANRGDAGAGGGVSFSAGGRFGRGQGAFTGSSGRSGRQRGGADIPNNPIDDDFARCLAAFCPPVENGEPCCVSDEGPCGADVGNGCSVSGNPRGGTGGRGGRGGDGDGGGPANVPDGSAAGDAETSVSDAPLATPEAGATDAAEEEGSGEDAAID